MQPPHLGNNSELNPKNAEPHPKIRTTGILIEDAKLLAVKQVLREQSHWNLPGGTVEKGETLEQCLVREMYEETGLHVEILELLYLCDRFKQLDAHIVDVCFLVQRREGSPCELLNEDSEETLGEVKMIPLSELTEYGFSSKFTQLVADAFPQKGSYQGDFHEFYGL